MPVSFIQHRIAIANSNKYSKIRNTTNLNENDIIFKKSKLYNLKIILYIYVIAISILNSKYEPTLCNKLNNLNMS